MGTQARFVFIGILLAAGLGLAGESVYISNSRPMSALESSLLNSLLWLVSALAGWLLNSIYARHSETNLLEERAKPAIRRVWELQRSAEQLQLILSTRDGNHPHTYSPESVAIQMQIGQLRAAVQDWRELLPEDYVETIIRQAQSEERPNAIPWGQFHDLINEVARRIDRSDAHGGFRPDLIVGVYPEGGIVAYLMWLALGRRCEVLLAPDMESNAPHEETVSTLEKNLLYHANGRSSVRVLVADASIKSGGTMAATVRDLNEAAAAGNLNIIVRTACVIDYPAPGEARSSDPDYIAMQGPYHLPFADS